ncbi:hypothetical protein HNR46_003497 [Haloferula luteola]|uniref:Uncharacterized protein n=1 Tax=Haloferula luteola TaxID=595692 RepID=A0A840V5J9_9BACT|nr:hypothetical protein [Haloferula luteola]MBB5353242.1 hypothetical protein [Haloferula luteola]
MKVLKALALGGLLLTAAGPLLMYSGAIDIDTNKTLMLIGMILWFLGATPWLGSNRLQPTDKEVEI